MRIGKKEKEILEAVSVGALLVGALIAPGVSSVVAPFLTHGGNTRQNTKKSIKKLEDKELIYLSGEKICLTERGKELLKKLQSEDIVIKKTEWDGIWRIIAYDIPEDYKKERDYFHLKLKELGFAEVQKSVYVLPYECLEEIAVFAQFLGLAPFVLYLKTDRLPRQEEFKKHFSV